MLSLVAARVRAEGGYSLPELLIVMVLLGVIGSVVTNSVVQGMQSTRRAQDRVAALTDLEKSVARIGRELRAACPVRTSTPTQVTVDSERQDTLWRYRYTLDTATQQLSEQRQRYDTASATWVTVADAPLISDATNTAAFSYVDTDNQATNDPSRVVGLGVTITRDLPEQDDITVTTRLSARNRTNCAS